ncbi:glycosyl hydrolase family 18 protein [Clostridium sp. MB40-C1]|uniref:glycosyl hydrolase family 18 protein n=1 Tax=Clostridium sp. MB40-C1 TaxID=3070996 RepID=UPI0027DF1D88|nr:glycosyl hydrolase family 18 protein [Clostridium sp. MB40-C1]WMJ80164.1 glycosyl hydrolase family 18 protein [Clostridium sp. MB40-C1]
MKYYKKLLLLIIVVSVFALNTSFIFAKSNKISRSVPNAPTSLNYTGVTTSEVTLNWQTVSGATGYKVYRATPNDSNYSLIATISTNSYKNTGLTSNTKYWYFVRAYSSFGTSLDSTHINLTTTQAALTSKKLVLGFATYYYSGDNSSYNSIATNTSTIDEIATHTYITDSYGKISGLVPTNQITYANSNSIKTLAMVSNNFDGNIAKTLLESPTNRQTLINNILNCLKVNGYKGVNIDFEGLYYYDRSYLTTFMSELYNTLHPQGFYVTIAVAAKTSDSPTTPWSGAYDYAALAKYSNQIVLMTYDEHYPGGTPGAIASINWVENVIKYALTVIPKEKLLLGTAAYSYDWSINGTKAYSISATYNLAATYGATIQWDSVSQSPYFTYSDASGVSHTVWFENAQSLNYKLNLVNSYDMSGIAIWRLGLENVDYWTSIKTKFNR